MELCKLITNTDQSKKADFDKLKIYPNKVNYDQLKLQEEAFLIYKNKFTEVDWSNIKELSFAFVSRKLNSFFPEIFKFSKIY